MSASPDNPPDHEPPGITERDGLGQNGTDLQLSHLSSRQVRALPILAAAPNMRQAARDAGISERTLYRWLQNEYFRTELKRLTAEDAQLIRRELQSLTLHSLRTLTELMEDPDPIVRLRAARAIAFTGVGANDAGSYHKDTQAVQ